MPDGQGSDVRGEVAALYEADASVAEIARQHGRSESWVARILKAEGVQRRGRWDKRLDPDRVVTEYLAGDSAATIAARYGRTSPAVVRILRDRGIRRRTRWDDLAPVDPAAVATDYLAGASLREVAQRHARSITWVRKTLASLGIPRRPRGGVSKDVSDKLIVRLRDDMCLSWEEIAVQVGMRPESVAARYASAAGALDHARYNFAGARADLEVWLRNDAANHRQEIVADYRAGQTAESLGRSWGISPRTVSRWAAAEQ